MDEISDEVIHSICQRQDEHLERWLGRLFLLFQTGDGRESVQKLLVELNDLVEKLTDEAQRHMNSSPAGAEARARERLPAHFRRTAAVSEGSRDVAQGAVMAEFVRYALGQGSEDLTAEEEAQRKLVVALSLWPELSARFKRA